MRIKSIHFPTRRKFKEHVNTLDKINDSLLNSDRRQHRKRRVKFGTENTCPP